MARKQKVDISIYMDLIKHCYLLLKDAKDCASVNCGH